MRAPPPAKNAHNHLKLPGNRRLSHLLENTIEKSRYSDTLCLNLLNVAILMLLGAYGNYESI
jgi:hypothetical protein